ncbi:MAG TPA: hypothetical protein VJY41_02600 [Prolixibacteraceae bacterium]|nr:hypothetical protein [Prolixibacteraceae bacterium]
MRGKVNFEDFKLTETNANEFLFSNIELGIFDNEAITDSTSENLQLIVFNRLEMILELNSKLIAN